MWSHCFPPEETPTTATPITQVTDQQCPSHVTEQQRPAHRLQTSNTHHVGYQAAMPVTQVMGQQCPSCRLLNSNAFIPLCRSPISSTLHTGRQTQQHLFRISGNDRMYIYRREPKGPPYGYVLLSIYIIKRLEELQLTEQREFGALVS